MKIGRTLWGAGTFAYHAAYNTLARKAPRWAQALQRATGDTGRGKRCVGGPAADYFYAVFNDFESIARHAGAISSAESLYKGKTILEYGPGDTLSVPVLALAEGATQVEAFDAFDIQSRDHAYLDAIYGPLLTKAGHAARSADGLSLHRSCTMHNSLESLERAGKRFDVVLSRAVLEHVRDLDGLFASMVRVMKDDGIAIHEIDLRSHGVEYSHPLDFLTFSKGKWDAMSSHIDLPNRVRAKEVLDLAERHGSRVIFAAVSHKLRPGYASTLRPSLDATFQACSDEELSILGMWFVQVGPAHPLFETGSLALHELPRAPKEKLSSYSGVTDIP